MKPCSEEGLEEPETADPFFGIERDISFSDFKDWGVDQVAYFKKIYSDTGSDVWHIYNVSGEQIGVTANLAVAKEMVRRYSLYSTVVQ